MLRRVAGFGLLGCIVLVLCSSAHAAIAGPAKKGTPPSLSVVGPDTLNADAAQANNDPTKATLRILVTNSGDQAATLSFAPHIDQGPNGTCGPDKSVTQSKVAPSPARAPGHSTTQFTVTLQMPRACVGHDGTLVVTAGGKVDPATARFTVTRDLGNSDAWIAVGVGVIAAFITACFLLWGVHGTLHSYFTRPVAVGPSWTVQGSWLTNVSALGALLGVVLGATDFLSNVLPGVSTAQFVGLNLLFGGMIAIAPIVYLAFGIQQEQEDGTTATAGTGFGLLAGVAVSLTGTYGVLTTLGLIAFEADSTTLARVLVIALLVVAGLIVATYAVRSNRDVANASKRKSDAVDHAMAPGDPEPRLVDRAVFVRGVMP